MNSATSRSQAGEKPHPSNKPRLVHGQNNSRERLDKKARYVLIVDDQPTGRKILEQIVHTIDRTLRVISFADPREALAQSKQEVPCLTKVRVEK